MKVLHDLGLTTDSVSPPNIGLTSLRAWVMLGAQMPNILQILLRILAGITGALLLYAAFFLYEDEEARIQNRLEQIWKRIDALQSSAMSKEAAFLQGVTRTTSA